MTPSFEPFDTARLARLLPAGQKLGARLRWVEATASTQDLLREELTTAGAQGPGTLILTGRQEAGRGRRRRDWWSGPDHANLAMSLAVEPLPDAPELLGMIAANAMIEALRPLCRGKRLALKWPNDILLESAKVAGTLVETSGPRGIALLGIGINLRAAPTEGFMPYPTEAVDPNADPEATVARWLAGLERRLTRARLHGLAESEAECLANLRAWAPHGVSDPRTAAAGPLVQFSVQHGLTWGEKGAEHTRPLGWIERLYPLPPPSN